MIAPESVGKCKCGGEIWKHRVFSKRQFDEGFVGVGELNETYCTRCGDKYVVDYGFEEIFRREKMEIQPRFKLGDMVWVHELEYGFIRDICTECEGTGKEIKYECNKCGHIARTYCTSCRGSGQSRNPHPSSKYTKYNVYGPYQITMIRVTVADNINYTYQLSEWCDDDYYINEEDLFTTKQEAIEAANTRTNKSMEEAELRINKYNLK